MPRKFRTNPKSVQGNSKKTGVGVLLGTKCI